MDNSKQNLQTIAKLKKQLGPVDMQQIIAWRKMTPIQRLDIAFQAYQFALDVVRLTERQRGGDSDAEEFMWRVTRRMQGNQKLGREFHDPSSA